jgi:hypothetical protein
MSVVCVSLVTSTKGQLMTEICFACEFPTTDPVISVGGEPLCRVCLQEEEAVFAALQEDWTEADLEDFYHQMNP